MRRQLRGKGGITNVTPRTNYFLGGIKDRIRKLIPNELANVASKAAPFVAMIPGQQGTAALMRGIGRFDQRGSISDALKQGALTYAGGKLFGAGMEKIGLRDPGASGIGEFFNEGTRSKAGSLFSRQTTDSAFKKPNIKDITDGSKSLLSGTRDLIKSGFKALPKGVAAQLAAGGITAGASLLASYFQGDFREQEPGETMEDYLAARKDVVGKQMRTYMDSYFKFDPEYSGLDDAGRNAFVARYNVKDGGMPTGIMRSNKAGVMERDYRDKGGFVPVGIKEKADDVPAMLSKNEFVMTANAVRGAGNGSIEKGAQRMYDTMKKLEKRAV
jgi:hypothetical protein